jgi:nitroreductase
MDILELIGQRYSARSYKPDEVEAEKLERILEAARLAPTAANRQAFRLVVVKTEGRKEQLRRMYPKDWFVQAPLLLGVCAIPERSWVRRDGKNYSDVDASIVMDHIVLTAAAQGLGTCWVGAFDVQLVRDILELDGELEPVAFTPLGYAADKPSVKTRKTLEELVIYR